jgi:hypothetical protein
MKSDVTATRLGCSVLSLGMQSLLRGLIRNQIVYDLGGGSCEHACWFLSNYAKTVEVVDRNPAPKCLPYQLRFHQRRFDEYLKEAPESASLAFLSWPCNWNMTGLVALLSRFSQVIYLGKNTDGSSCGGPDLWEHLQTRRVLHYIAHPSNCLTLYGEPLLRGERRLPTGEERAALDTSKCYRFQEAEDGV